VGTREVRINAYWKYKKDKIHDNGFAVFTLIKAKSLPQHKDPVVTLIVNILVEGNLK